MGFDVVGSIPAECCSLRIGASKRPIFGPVHYHHFLPSQYWYLKPHIQMMIASAQTPIEIWHMILSLAVDSPLLPHQDGDVVDLMTLFSSACRSQRNHIASEITRTCLRLVCRTWNQFLKDQGVQLVLSRVSNPDPSWGLHEMAQRLEILTNIECQCGIGCHFTGKVLPSFNQQRISYGYQGPKTNYRVDSNSLLRLMEVIVARSSIELNLLDRMPYLRALEFIQPQNGQANFIQRRSVRNLAHLQLKAITATTLDDVVGNVSFANLRSLSIDFESTSDQTNYQPPHCTPIDKWHFPVLRTLRICGHIERRISSSVLALIRQPRPALYSVYFDFTYAETANESTPFAITPSFWTSLPNLRVLGVGLPTLENEPSLPPPMYPQFTLVMEGIRRRPHIPSTRPVLTGSYSLIPILQVLHEWNPNEILLLSSWADMSSSLRQQKSSDPSAAVWPRTFFTALMDRGIKMVDIDKRSISDDEGILFLQTLLDGVPRKRSKRKTVHKV